MPATKRQMEASNLYSHLMEEAKARITAIDLLAMNVTKLPGFIAEEMGYLQLRMLCEIIALGCVVAHGDIEAAQTNRFQKEWSADKLVGALETLHTHFFPIPVRAKGVRKANGNQKLHELEGAQSGFLTKERLVKLYAECGQTLHRGNAKKLASKSGYKPDFAPIMKWRSEIMTLLDIHILSLFDPDTMFICVMSDSAQANRATVSFAETLRDQQPLG